ncbi:YgjP-like metallopeptidase domain-containing protein [Streptomyces coelicoflavus]|uniref:YgjP-like metallopeptidase domain-containing protein n=1 Tax=Streptomyces coelicoflavus TaxID=285562 RepID=UPI00367B34C3
MRRTRPSPRPAAPCLRDSHASWATSSATPPAPSPATASSWLRRDHHRRTGRRPRPARHQHHGSRQPRTSPPKWIYRQLLRLQQNQPTPVTKTLVEGEEFTVFGTPHRLHLATITDDDQPVSVDHPETGPHLHLDRRLANRPDQARNTLIHWNAQQAQNWLDQNGEQLVPKTEETKRASVPPYDSPLPSSPTVPATNSSCPGPQHN